MSALSKIFGSHSERELKRIYPIADKVESYKEAMGKLSDEELKGVWRTEQHLMIFFRRHLLQ